MRSIKKQIATLFTVAKARGYSPLWTHYYRTTEKGQKVLAATSCVLLEDLTPVSRGVSVVSEKDIGDKAFGRYLSLQRAFGVAMGGPIEVMSGADGPPQIGETTEYFKAIGVTALAVEAYLTRIELDRIRTKGEKRALRKTA